MFLSIQKQNLLVVCVEITLVPVFELGEKNTMALHTIFLSHCGPQFEMFAHLFSKL